jgi:hypothetical protein
VASGLATRSRPPSAAGMDKQTPRGDAVTPDDVILFAVLVPVPLALGLVRRCSVEIDVDAARKQRARTRVSCLKCIASDR